jgi:hypothetical protein
MDAKRSILIVSFLHLNPGKPIERQVERGPYKQYFFDGLLY